VAQTARDARVWVAVLLAFLYGVAPDIYQRATRPIVTNVAETPSLPGFTQQQMDEKIAAAVANLNAELAEANRQKDAARREEDALHQQIQNAPPQTPAPEDQIPIGWQPDFQPNWFAGPKVAWIRFIGASHLWRTSKTLTSFRPLLGTKKRHRQTLGFAGFREEQIEG
jgi:hypothetical protein